MKRTLLLLSVLLLSTLAPGTYSSKYFGALKNCNKSDRVKLASDINYNVIVALDMTKTLSALDELKQFSKEQDDRELQVLEVLLRGEFYYRTLDNKCTSYFNEGLVLSQKYGFEELKAEALHDLGLQYYRDDKYNLAFEYLLKGNYLMKDLGYATYPAISRYLFELGNVYYQFGDYEKSRRLLEEAVLYPHPEATYGIKINNTLGLCNRELGNLEAAKTNFIKTVELAKKTKQDVWIGIGTGNLGSIYFKLKQYNEAIPLFNVDYRLSVENKEFQSASTTLCVLAEIYISKNKPDSAAYFLDKATALLQVVNDPLNYRSYYNRKADYYKLSKDYAQAFIYLDSGNYYNKLLIKRDFANIKAKAEQKAAVEKYLSDLQLLETKKEIQVLTRNGIITALLLVLIITALILHRLRQKRQHDKEKIANAAEQLNLYLESIKEKNNLIDKFEDQLQNINLQHSNEETITRLQNYTILTEDDWNEFRRLFEKVHSNFFVRLKQKYPALTQSEVRLMALIKLNLARKEMADMLGISPDSVKKTRQRIKKRIELEENMDLEEIVYNL